MRAKNLVCVLSLFLVLSAQVCYADATQTKTSSLSSGNLVVNLAYPSEAHPMETITHNVTISGEQTTLLNFSIVIKAMMIQSWQEIYSGQDTTQKLLPQPYNLIVPLPQETNGSLQCFISIETNKGNLSFTILTTEVRALTYDELLINYNSIVANYSALLTDYNTIVANYTALVGSYNDLLSQYNTLSSKYNITNENFAALNSTYNQLSNNYNSLNIVYDSLSSTHSALQESYNSLKNNSSVLMIDFKSLNSTYYNVQNNYSLLTTAYTSLNNTYNALQEEVSTLGQKINVSESALNNDKILMFIFIAVVAGLVALVFYIKRKKPEPYIVIRKETVALKQEEEK